MRASRAPNPPIRLLPTQPSLTTTTTTHDPAQIEDKLVELGTVDRFSIIGYSMGGLIARYTIGRMLERGHFERIRPLVRTRAPSLGGHPGWP